VGWYQKGNTNLDFTEARDSEWQWHQLGHMQVCTLLQSDNPTRTPPLSLLQAGCFSCRPTNSVKALKAFARNKKKKNNNNKGAAATGFPLCGQSPPHGVGAYAVDGNCC